MSDHIDRDGLADLLYGIDGEGRDGWPRWLASLPWDIRALCKRQVARAREQVDELRGVEQGYALADAGISELQLRVEDRDAEIAMLRSRLRSAEGRKQAIRGGP